MNRLALTPLAFALSGALLLAACAQPAQPAQPTQPAAPSQPEPAAAPTKLRAKLVLNGTLGDKSFFDSAQRGMDLMKNELGWEVRTIECTYDRNRWLPCLEDAAAADDYDILIAGTFDMSDYVTEVAPKYPNKRFWMFDAAPNYEACANKCENVYTVLFRQNEGSYLLGVLAANILKNKALPNITDDSKIGIIGGMDIPVINDFIVGFKQGMRDQGVDPEQRTIVQYVGGDNPWNNPARGKEIALSMFNQGAAIVWGVAGNSGSGAFEAAVEAKAFTFGVDSDQYFTIADPAQRATIVTSMLKNVDQGLFRAAKLHLEGKLGYGAPEPVGVAGGAVGVAVNENTRRLLGEDLLKVVDEAAQAIKDGKIVVETAFK
ncbi:MAG: BMP family ABC transporter substrate-binding protein [Anaerolineae bacterium]|nr:BMP family ABC transporter substrate-binding protein [Thermoflexales bacterium]MDW8396595.1 BMP family ABC transporter substrate-binding protein [Anaerolineae bacterium]